MISKLALLASLAILSTPSFAESETVLASWGDDIGFSHTQDQQFGQWRLQGAVDLRVDDSVNATTSLFALRQNKFGNIGGVVGYAQGENEFPFLGFAFGFDLGAQKQFALNMNMVYWLAEDRVNSHTINTNAHYSAGGAWNFDFDWAHHSLIDNNLLFDEYRVTAGYKIIPSASLFAGLQLTDTKKETEYFDDGETALIFGVRIHSGSRNFGQSAPALPSNVTIGKRADYY